MKKHFLKVLCLLLAMLILNTQTFANTFRLLSLNSNKDTEKVTVFEELEIYGAFSEVEDLLAYLETHENVTYNDVENDNGTLVENISAMSMSAFSSASADTPIFSSFMWGCLFNWIGMLIVAISTGFDGYSIRKSFWGCLINSLIIGVSYGGYHSTL